MGSDLYDVTVLSTQDASVSLAVEVVHPDAMHLPEDPSFALMMLRECATPDAPLAREVAFEDLHDTTWVAKFTTGFVAGVHVHDVQQTSRTMRGIVDITVTHPAWVAHLARGQRWSSRAFDVAQRYDVHPPIAPCERHGTVAAEVAFVWVPREVFLPYRAPQSIPSLLEAPAYSPSAYEVSHEVREHFEQCVGRAVVVRTRDRELHGALAAVVDRRVAVAHLSRGARGVNWLEPQSVGLLAPAARRRGTRLSMTEVLAVTPVTATYIGADGAHVELSVRVPPDGRAVPIASETDVLDLLVWPLRESAFGELVDSELARALRADLDARGMEGAHRLEEIYPQIARRYVAGFRVEAVPFDVPAWHELSHLEVHSRLAGPWPTMQLMVELTDAKWATHLVGTRAIVLRDAPLPTALAAPPEPEKPSLPSTSPPDQRGVLARDDRVWIGERRGATWTSWTGKRATDVRPTKQKDAGSAERARAAHGDRGLRPARMSCSTAAPRVLPHADVDHVGRNSNVEHQHRRCSASCYSRH